MFNLESGFPGNDGLELTGTSEHDGVSRLAIESVVAAVGSVHRFCSGVFGKAPAAVIDRSLVDVWCTSSFVPDNWKIPPKWDRFSDDYRTRDGWVRLHCNAPHHRKSALHVLGKVETPRQAKTNAMRWQAHDLAEAVVDAGGCASELFTTAQWRDHAQGRAVAKEPVVAWKTAAGCPSNWAPGPFARPLRGLRVLDLTRIIAGPVSTRFLASLGADVLRIDPPGWTEGANEVEMTLGKSCAQLDLRQATARATFTDLVRSAHVLVHGYRRDALERLGFGPDNLTRLNPALISVGLTAYGWTGPWKNRRGFDSLVQRSTGLAVESGEKIIDLPYQVLDHATGYFMAAAVIEAVRLQLTQNTAAHAYLSLARQAQLLFDAGVDAGAVQQAGILNRMQIAQQQGTRESTSWGPGWRCPLPYRFEEVVPGWSMPAHPLRSDRPQWAGHDGKIS